MIEYNSREMQVMASQHDQIQDLKAENARLREQVRRLQTPARLAWFRALEANKNNRVEAYRVLGLEPGDLYGEVDDDVT